MTEFQRLLHKSFIVLWRLLRSAIPVLIAAFLFTENAQDTVASTHTDHLGTPQELTDAEGKIEWSADYGAWGQRRHSLVLDKDEEAEQRTDCALRFQGQYFDAETGLHYNTFRYYDPGCGRFISPDPINLLGGLNLYQYAPNAWNWIDPWGLTALQDMVAEAHGQLDSVAQNYKTTAIGVDSQGNYHIASSDPKVPKVQQVWAKNKSINVVNGIGHAEETLMNANKGVTQIEASRPVCIDCETQMTKQKVKTDSPLSGKKSKGRMEGSSSC